MPLVGPDWGRWGSLKTKGIFLQRSPKSITCDTSSWGPRHTHKPNNFKKLISWREINTYLHSIRMAYRSSKHHFPTHPWLACIQVDTTAMLAQLNHVAQFTRYYHLGILIPNHPYNETSTYVTCVSCDRIKANLNSVPKLLPNSIHNMYPSSYHIHRYLFLSKLHNIRLVGWI